MQVILQIRDGYKMSQDKCSAPGWRLRAARLKGYKQFHSPVNSNSHWSIQADGKKKTVIVWSEQESNLRCQNLVSGLSVSEDPPPHRVATGSASSDQQRGVSCRSNSLQPPSTPALPRRYLPPQPRSSPGGKWKFGKEPTQSRCEDSRSSSVALW